MIRALPGGRAARSADRGSGPLCRRRGRRAAAPWPAAASAARRRNRRVAWPQSANRSSSGRWPGRAGWVQGRAAWPARRPAGPGSRLPRPTPVPGVRSEPRRVHDHIGPGRDAGMPRHGQPPGSGRASSVAPGHLTGAICGSPCTRTLSCNSVTQPICWLSTSVRVRLTLSQPGDRRCCSAGHESWQVTASWPTGPSPGALRRSGAPAVTVRLLTNIGRLWTGSEVWSNAAILSHDDRIAWVGPASELPGSIPGVIEDIVDVDHVENLNGGLVTPGLIDAHTHPVYAGNRYAELAMRSSGSSAGGDRRRRRRDGLHGHRHPGDRPLDALRRGAGAAAPVAAERDHHDRGQDRLSPDPGRGTGRHPPAPLAGRRERGAAHARDVPRRARRAARVLRAPPRLHRRGQRLVRGRGRGRSRQRRRLLR